MVDISAELKEKLRFISKCRSEFSDDQIKNIKQFDLSSDVKELVAIDGSYSFLFNISSIWLAIVRVGALTYTFEDGKYILKDNEVVEKAILVSTNEKINDELGAVNKQLFLSTKNAQEQHCEMVNRFRQLMEQEMMFKMSKKLKGGIVAVDGTLTPGFSKWVEMAVEACKDNNNILVGVSKDSNTHAFGSYRTDEEILKKEETWGYVRVPKSFEQKQKGLIYGDVYFAKLHPNAPKWFRIDIATFKDDTNFVFSNLAHYAKFGMCIGYIYPLFEAHRYVVTVRQFKDLYEDIILKSAAELNIPMDDVINGLTHIDGLRKGAFHEFLDQASRGG